MSVLEDLYFGALEPTRRNIAQTGRNKPTSEKFTRLEETLTERLEGENKKLFLALVNTGDEMMGEAAVTDFIEGFRLGAKLMSEIYR